MRLTILSLLVSSLAVQEAAASLSHTPSLWGTEAQPYMCSCRNVEHHCTKPMENGWKFDSAPNGAEVQSYYAGFVVQGLVFKDACTTAGTSKKCVSAKLKASVAESVRITRVDEHAENGFSISHLHISANIKAKIAFTYTMTDGSTCKHTTGCGPGLNVVQNKQCGGAISVTVEVVEEVDVELDIYQIHYECGHKNGPPKPKTKTLPPPKSTGTEDSRTKTPATSFVPPTGFPPTGTGFPLPSPTPKTKTHKTKTPKPTTYGGESPPIGTPRSTLPGVFPTGPGIFPTGFFPTGTAGVPPATITPTSSPPEATPSLPPVRLPPPGDKCHPVPGECPPVVPKCLATWLHITNCGANTDTPCYCRHQEYTRLVIDCINARGCSKLEIDIGFSYFVGLCVPYIPVNPGIITDLPPDVHLGPPPPNTVPGISGGHNPPIEVFPGIPKGEQPPSKDVPGVSGGNKPPGVLVPSGHGNIHEPTPNNPGSPGPVPNVESPPNTPVPLIPVGSGNIYPTCDDGKPSPSCPEKPPTIPFVPPGQKPPPPFTVVSIVTTVEVPVTTPAGNPVTPGPPVPTHPLIISKVITVPQVRFDVTTLPGRPGGPPDVEGSLVPGPSPIPTPVGTLPPFSTGEVGTLTPTFRLPEPTGTGAQPTRPLFTGAANANNKAGKVVGGLAGGLAALLLI